AGQSLSALSRMLPISGYPADPFSIICPEGYEIGSDCESISTVQMVSETFSKTSRAGSTRKRPLGWHSAGRRLQPYDTQPGGGPVRHSPGRRASAALSDLGGFRCQNVRLQPFRRYRHGWTRRKIGLSNRSGRPSPPPSRWRLELWETLTQV
ncbi:unnamed protein product, partial [Nesidiocoris tenuis]